MIHKHNMFRDQKVINILLNYAHPKSNFKSVEVAEAIKRKTNLTS